MSDNQVAVVSGGASFVGSHVVDRLLDRGYQARPFVVSFEQGVSNILGQIDYWREVLLWDPQSIAQASRVWFKYMAKADVDG
jgi:nucleoside-diphosphate-sugar epimerase